MPLFFLEFGQKCENRNIRRKFRCEKSQPQPACMSPEKLIDIINSEWITNKLYVSAIISRIRSYACLNFSKENQKKILGKTSFDKTNTRCFIDCEENSLGNSTTDILDIESFIEFTFYSNKYNKEEESEMAIALETFSPSPQETETSPFVQLQLVTEFTPQISLQ